MDSGFRGFRRIQGIQRIQEDSEEAGRDASCLKITREIRSTPVQPCAVRSSLRPPSAPLNFQALALPQPPDETPFRTPCVGVQRGAYKNMPRTRNSPAGTHCNRDITVCKSNARINPCVGFIDSEDSGFSYSLRKPFSFYGFRGFRIQLQG